MENLENASDLRTKPFITGIIYLCFLIGLGLVLTLTYYLSTKKAINKTIITYNLNYQNQGQSPDNLLISPDFFNQKKEIDFLESKYLLAKNDSVGLIINLDDSTLSLQLKGIMLHSAKIYEFTTGSFFSALNPSVYLNIFSKPWTIVNHYGTVVKEPITVKNAPKDTIEAQNAVSTMPDTTIQHLSNVVLLAENGIQIMLIQQNDTTPNQKTNWAFVFNERWKLFETNFSRLVHLSLPEYIPTIKIIASENDIKTIYRSLPEHPQVVIYLND